MARRWIGMTVMALVASGCGLFGSPGGAKVANDGDGTSVTSADSHGSSSSGGSSTSSNGGSASVKDAMPPWEVAQRAQRPQGAGPFVTDTGIELTFGAKRKGTSYGSAKWDFAKGEPSDVRFFLWGKSSSSDRIVLSFKVGGKTITKECPAPDIADTYDTNARSYDDREQVRCTRLDENHDLAMAEGLNAFDISYKSAENGTTTKLRTVSFKLASAVVPHDPDSREWFVDGDSRIGENFAMWLGSDALTLFSYAKLAAVPSAAGSLKCTVDGKEYAPSNGIAGYVSFNESWRGGENKTWVKLTATMIGSHDKLAAGKYECKALAEGKLLRVFKFELDAERNIVKAPQQSQIVAPSTLIPDTTIPAGVDLAYDKAAFTQRGFFGRPLK